MSGTRPPESNARRRFVGGAAAAIGAVANSPRPWIRLDSPLTALAEM